MPVAAHLSKAMSLTTNIIVGVLLVAAAIVLIAFFALRSKHRRHVDLHERFGPEYDRALERYGSQDRAERELAGRARRVRRLHIRDLGADDRLRYSAAWKRVQTQFVDDPAGAVVRADDLIKSVMHDRGYPVEDFDQRVADLTVEHAGVVQHYRAARALTEANSEGPVDTEELRQAIVHYRALFADLLGEHEDTAEPTRRPQELHP